MKSKSEFILGLSLGQKFTLLQVGVAIVFLAIFMVEFREIMSRFFNEQLDQRIRQNNEVISNFVHYRVIDQTNSLFDAFEGGFNLHFGESRRYAIKGKVRLENDISAPNLTLNGISLANDFDIVDRFILIKMTA